MQQKLLNLTQRTKIAKETIGWIVLRAYWATEWQAPLRFMAVEVYPHDETPLCTSGPCPRWGVEESSIGAGNGKARSRAWPARTPGTKGRVSRYVHGSCHPGG